MADRQPSVPAAVGGRPRDPARDTAILEAALHLLADVGYDRVSVASVAARAGVAKTTIYRRWNDKASMIAAAVAARAIVHRAPSPTGDLRSTVLQVVTDLSQQIVDQGYGLLTAIFAARRADPALADALRHLLQRDRDSMMSPVLEAAQRSGQKLAPDVADVFAELVPALLLHHLLVLDGQLDTTRLEHLVDRMVLPLIVVG